jgi:membrane protease YdiL (CAAX protease family)
MLGKSGAETGGGMAERSKDRGLGAFVRRHGLVSFYAMAYGMSWLFWLPYVLSQNGLGVLDVSFPEVLGTTQLAGILLGAYLGPLGAAFVVTALSEGRPGLRRWGGRLFRWGVNWRWYALALLGVPALLAAGTLVVSPGAAAGLRFPALGVLLAYVPFLVLQMLTTGLAEEPGWRDFALVRHQRQQGPLVGTLILGVLWAGWHLPLFLTDWGRENGGANPSNILSFVLFCLLFSVFITWVFNKTRGSLPLVMLVHASNNNFASVMLFAVFTTLNPSDATLSWAGVIGFAVPALAIVAATRGRLGYRPELLDDEPVRQLGGVPAAPSAADGGSDLPAAREA